MLSACVQAGVKKPVYTKSGAAYGHPEDNPPLLREDDALRGNEVFAYAWHERLVEERLAEYREDHPKRSRAVLRSLPVGRAHAMELDITDA